MELGGEGYSFEKFLEFDAVNRGNKSSSKASRSRSAGKMPHDAPPTVIRKSQHHPQR